MKLQTKKRLLNALTVVFLVLEAVLCVLVQTTANTLNIVVSFLAVVLACLFALFSFAKTKEYYLTQAALVFTVLADLFLVVITPRYSGLAMVFFSGTQICYFLRIFFNQENKKEKLVHLVSRALLVVIAMTATVLVLKEKTDFVSLISLFYYANLLMNIVFAFVQTKKSLIFAIGLLLFALCDVFVGFGVLNQAYLEIPEGSIFYWLAHPKLNFAWLFYVPSQALLSVSSLKTKFKMLK